MGIRFAGLVLVLVSALAACGGDDPDSAESPGASQTRLSSPTDPMTEVVVPCAEFSAAAEKIAEAQRDLYSASGTADAVDTLATELGALKDGAPAAVKTAIDDLVAAFRTASELLDEPTATAQAELAALAAKLSDAGKTVSDYVVDKCTG